MAVYAFHDKPPNKNTQDPQEEDNNMAVAALECTNLQNPRPQVKFHLKK